jgi:hypothetical protein
MRLHMSDADRAKAAEEWGAQYRAELEALGVGGTVPIEPEAEAEPELEIGP